MLVSSLKRGENVPDIPKLTKTVPTQIRKYYFLISSLQYGIFAPSAHGFQLIEKFSIRILGLYALQIMMEAPGPRARILRLIEIPITLIAERLFILGPK